MATTSQNLHTTSRSLRLCDSALKNRPTQLPNIGKIMTLRRIWWRNTAEHTEARTELSGFMLHSFRHGPRPIPETPKDIGVDFALAARIRQNNQKNFARCDTWTVHGATRESRTVQHDDIAPCDSPKLHPATPRSCTLPLSRVTPCDPKCLLWDSF